MKPFNEQAKTAHVECVPWLSIIVAVYNAQQWIGECLASIRTSSELADDGECFEVICVDDGSTDGTLNFLEKTHYPWLRVAHQDNAGVSVARNTGIELSKGHYLCFVDADDVVAPEFLTTLLPELRKGVFDVVFFGIDQIVDGDKLVAVGKKNSANIEVSGKDVPAVILDPGNCYQGFAVGKCVRRDIVSGSANDNIRFDVAMRFLEDEMFWLHVAERGLGRCLLLRNRLYRYRVNCEGLTQTVNADGGWEELAAREAVWSYAVEKNMIGAENAGWWLRFKSCSMAFSFFKRRDFVSLCKLYPRWRAALACGGVPILGCN